MPSESEGQNTPTGSKLLGQAHFVCLLTKQIVMYGAAEPMNDYNLVSVPVWSCDRITVQR